MKLPAWACLGMAAFVIASVSGAEKYTIAVLHKGQFQRRAIRRRAPWRTARRKRKHYSIALRRRLGQHRGTRSRFSRRDEEKIPKHQNSFQRPTRRRHPRIVVSGGAKPS